jgi:hypothetical protein
MASYIFQQIAKKGKAEGIDDTNIQRDTRTWFRETAQNITKVNNPRLFKDKENLVQIIDKNSIGKMYLFMYDPKHKNTLPYYDTYPLIFPLNITGTGFLGINMHYLPLYLRAKLMDKLYTTVSNKKYDDSTKLNINYGILNGASKFKYFKPCVKQYLWSHVKGNGFLNIPPKMWDAALFLPTQKFVKAGEDVVWNDSQKKVGK